MPTSLTVPLVAYATPDEAPVVLAVLVALLDGAQHSVHGCLYALTHPALIAALERAGTRGVDVKLVLDESQSTGATEKKLLPGLVASLTPARITVTTSPTGALMHRKNVSVDGTVLVSGSCNWSESAMSETNDVLVITSPALVAAYETVFQGLWTRHRATP